MMFAQLDLSKATELARVAQDAAVIAGVNSSEALENIILGITTGQTRLLHNMGLQVSLEQTIAKGERELGRAMSESEKRTYMLNEVLAQGVKIHGAYEASMQTAGKQMTSLTRYWQEAKNAVGSEFLPEMRNAITGLTELAKWTRENADTVASWARAIAAAAVGAAIAKFVTWVGGAKKAVGLLNLSLARSPWYLAIIATTVAASKLYEMWQESKNLETQLEEQNKTAADTAKILYYIGERGKTVEQLKQMGFSVEKIRTAFMGSTEAADEFVTAMDNMQFKTRIKVINQGEIDAEARRQAQELATEMAKKQRETERDTFAAAVSAERAAVSGPGRALLEFAEKARKAAVFVDPKGNEHAMRLTARTIENLERENAARVLAIQRETVNQTLELARTEAAQRMEWNTDVYRSRIEQDAEIASQNLDHVERLYQIEEDRAGLVRDARLRAAEAMDAQTLEQKVAVEQQKAKIEIDYIEQVHEIKMRLFDLETSRMVMEEESNLKRLGYRAEEIAARIAELTQQRDAIRWANQEATDAAIDAARQNAANRTASMIRDHNRQVFDSFKRQAEGVFDALVSKSQSVWSSIGNSFKTAMLTAIKEVVTSRVAAMLMQLFGIGGGGYAPAGRAGGGVVGGGGWATVLGGFGGGFFGGGGGPIPGGMGGGWSTPPFFPAGGGAGATGGAPGAGFGNWGDMASSYKGLLSNLGNIGFRPERWRMDEMGNMTKLAGARGVGGWQGGAVLAGGAMLAMDGLRRGGWLGVGETTAGGALIGAKFGGPIGAAIGAAVGFGAGIVRLFVKGAQEKAREKIRAIYGVDITDKNVLKQIVDTAKSAFGGNLDMAIRSQQIRDIVELYAMSTGKKTTGMPGTMQPVGLVQSGGSLFQSKSGGFAGIGAASSIDGIGGGVASGGGPVVIQLDGPATTALLRGEAVQAIADSPRAVQEAAVKAMKANSGRRQMATLQMSPGLITV